MTAAPLLLDLTLALEHLLCLLQLCLHTQSTHARHDVETEGTLTVRSSVLFIESIFVISFSCSSFRSIDISASCRANSLSPVPRTGVRRPSYTVSLSVAPFSIGRGKCPSITRARVENTFAKQLQPHLQFGSLGEPSLYRGRCAASHLLFLRSTSCRAESYRMENNRDARIGVRTSSSAHRNASLTFPTLTQGCARASRIARKRLCTHQVQVQLGSG